MHQKILPITFKIAFFSLQNLLKFPLFFAKSLQFFSTVCKISPFLNFLLLPRAYFPQSIFVCVSSQSKGSPCIIRRNITHFNTFRILTHSFRVSEQHCFPRASFASPEQHCFPRATLLPPLLPPSNIASPEQHCLPRANLLPQSKFCFLRAIFTSPEQHCFPRATLPPQSKFCFLRASFASSEQYSLPQSNIASPEHRANPQST